MNYPLARSVERSIPCKKIKQEENQKNKDQWVFEKLRKLQIFALSPMKLQKPNPKNIKTRILRKSNIIVNPFQRQSETFYLQ